jgi:hypothetical protein
MVFPEPAHLHLAQFAWLAESVDHLFSDQGVQRLALVSFHLLALLVLLPR